MFLHTYDWLLFAGLPLALVSLALLRRPVDGASKLAWALWLSVLVVAVSGTARGETARVWSFFTPFVVVAAAGVIRDNRGAWVALTASHAAMFLALTPTWVVFGAEEMTPPQQEYYALAPSQPAGVTFNDEMRLNAWQVNTYPDNNQLTLWLGWQAHRRMTDAYWFSALLVSADGVPTGESVVWQGQDTRYPTTCWRPGERVIDPVVIPYPADVLSGDYWLSLAAFPDGQPDNRLPVTLPDGSQDTQIGLGPVTLP